MNNNLTITSLCLDILAAFLLLVIVYSNGYFDRTFTALYINLFGLPTDNLSSQLWWQYSVNFQIKATQNKKYDVCIFGDSITAPLGNIFGKNTFNFALNGMSTISLIEQLKKLISANVKFKKAIIAIGTNDACYRIADDIFVKNMQQIIALLKKMGANDIILLPAFYSTVAASHNPLKAGTIARVEEINDLIRQVAATENVLLSEEVIQPLFEGQAMKVSLTNDGVHLNADGKKIYRQALLTLLSSSL
jgi:lysophospholipase L1-like esterase